MIELLVITSYDLGHDWQWMEWLGKEGVVVDDGTRDDDYIWH